MSSIWKYRLHAIIPQAEANASNAFWTMIGYGDAEAQSYGVPLSANGQEPASYRGISSAFTAEMLAKLKVLLPDLGSLSCYVIDAWSFELLEQYNGNLVIGDIVTWEDALSDRGVQVINPSEVL